MNNQEKMSEWIETNEKELLNEWLSDINGVNTFFYWLYSPVQKKECKAFEAVLARFLARKSKERDLFDSYCQSRAEDVISE